MTSMSSAPEPNPPLRDRLRERERTRERDRRRERGHTLLEILVALAIVAALASIAEASYSHFVVGARRLDARQALSTLAAAQERHYLRHARYAVRLLDDDTVGTLVRGTGPDASTLPLPDTSAQRFYRVAIVAADEEGYRLEARPLGAQLRDRDCAVFTIEATGRRTARDSNGADATRRCWAGA